MSNRNGAYRFPPHRRLGGVKGVSVSASVACVPIASAKVRRISAPRKEMHKKTALFCEKRSQFRIPTLQTLSKPPFSGPFRGFPQGFWQESGRNALSGAGRGRENEGGREGAPIYNNREKREGTEKRAWQGAAKKPNRGSQPPTERTEAMGGEAQDDHFGGQSKHFEGAL